MHQLSRQRTDLVPSTRTVCVPTSYQQSVPIVYQPMFQSTVFVTPVYLLDQLRTNSVPASGWKLFLTCTISLKGIVQRKGPIALPSSGRKRTTWFSRVYASSEPSLTAGKFGVVVKVLGFQSPGGFDRGSNPVGPNFFFLGKKGKRKPRHFSAFPFPHKKLPDCRQFVTSLTFKMESRERIIFVYSNEAIRPQHTMHPASSLRQLAIAQWLVRPAVNLHNITPYSLH